ncbi:MAG: hypothetical protein NTY71_07885 [Methanoregula sp.]|jgi:hypothetical protein|nr:hypothetical protein [Methanoregula sp.]
MRITYKPTYTFLLLLITLIIINTLLARFAVIALPFGGVPGVSTLYFAVVFMILFTLWFGAYGAVAAYVGCFIGAGVLSGIPPEVSVYWSLADLWQVLIPLVALRMLNVDLSLEKRRDIIFFVVFGILINNAFGAVWGAVMLALGNVIQWTEVMPAFIGWFAGNVILTALIVPLALRHITPKIQKSKIFVRNYWD